MSAASATPDPRRTAPAAKPRARRTDVARLPFLWSCTSRSREGELYRRIIRALTQHVGGRPSPAEGLLIARIAWLQVHLAHIDERAQRDGGLSPHATREYLAWSNTLAKLIGRLGLKGAAAQPASLAEQLRQERAGR